MLIDEQVIPKLLWTVLLLTATQFVFSHGTVTSPASRVWNCYQENPENPSSPPCIAAVISHGTQPLYDWNGINQANANGQHMLYVMDGNLASGGRPMIYGGLDQVTPDWVATTVSAGPDTITWTNSAPHATAYYQVYITKDSWTPSQPLTWDNLILLVQTPPSAAASSVDIPVILPVRTGKHVIYSVWQRSDSPEAFYSTSDVDFGSSLSISAHKETSATFEQNYPNPFNSITTINYSLKEKAFVSLKVYNILGVEVSTLLNDITYPGQYKLVFNREKLPNGVYFYIFQVGDFIEAKRMIIHGIP